VAANPEAPAVDVVATAVELTTVAKLTEIAAAAAAPAAATATQAPPSAPTETPKPESSPTPCAPSVTANTVANIRSGPGTAYDVVGTLPLGGVAKVGGRNDANTWWYIEFSGGVGGHAWIAGSVTTAACLPQTVEIVAAPVLPTAQPIATGETVQEPPASGMPDLVAYGWQWAPIPGKKDQELSIMVSVTNNGTAAAGRFKVAWWSNQTTPGCDWTLDSLAVGERQDLECKFVYSSQTYPAASNTFYIAFVVDLGNHLPELNENNNKKDATWVVKK